MDRPDLIAGNLADQRNHALNGLAVALADLALANERIKALEAEIDALKNKPEEA